MDKKIALRTFGFLPEMERIDSMQCSISYRERYGESVDWHEFSSFLDELSRMGSLNSLGPIGPDRFMVYEFSSPSVQDILPYWGSYLSDLEGVLKHDPESWERYEDEPEGFMIDLLSDFGEGYWSDDQIESAVLNYLGKNQDVGPQEWNPTQRIPLSDEEKRDLLSIPESSPDDESETFWGIIESMNKKSLDGVRDGLERLNQLHLEDGNI